MLIETLVTVAVIAIAVVGGMFALTTVVKASLAASGCLSRKRRVDGRRGVRRQVVLQAVPDGHRNSDAVSERRRGRRLRRAERARVQTHR